MRLLGNHQFGLDSDRGGLTMTALAYDGYDPDYVPRLLDRADDARDAR
jgi:hypothetical protein